MTVQPPFERLGRELEAAAERQRDARAARRARPLRRRRSAALALATALLAGVAAAAWAATALLSTGSPVPFWRGAPVPGRAEGAPVPGTVRMLVDDLPDPGGGPPWGLRYWRTDRQYACVQAGRVYDGGLGQITGRVFHELRVGVTVNALAHCVVLDGAGHGFIALHLDAGAGAAPSTCPVAVSGHDVLSQTFPGCRPMPRTVDLGLLGPHARRYRYRSDGRLRSATPLGPDGAYLVVQRHLRPVIHEYGFHHRDPRLNLRGPAEPSLAVTPASQVIAQIAYDRGTCTTRVTGDPYGSCYGLAGFTPIPQPRTGDLAARIHAFPAPDGRGIRVRFHAPQSVVDGRSGYDIEVRPAGLRTFMTADDEHDVEAGALVHTTVPLYRRHHGRFRIVVRYRTVAARPGPGAPIAWPGKLVGHTSVRVP